MGIDINKLSAIRVGLASPDKIMQWSHGDGPKILSQNKPSISGFCER